MSNQLFKEKVPNEILINLFKIIGTRYENYYIIDNNSYNHLLWEMLPFMFFEKQSNINDN